jgi:hypothetical protein
MTSPTNHPDTTLSPPWLPPLVHAALERGYQLAVENLRNLESAYPHDPRMRMAIRALAGYVQALSPDRIAQPSRIIRPLDASPDAS